MVWALGLSPLMGSRGKCWKWLVTMPSGWWPGEEAGRLAGRLSQPAGQVSLGSLFLSRAHPLGLQFGFGPGGLWERPCLAWSPFLLLWCPPVVAWAGRGASQDLPHSVGLGGTPCGWVWDHLPGT